MTEERLSYLFEAYKDRTCSEDELNQFLTALHNPVYRKVIEKLTKENWEKNTEVVAETKDVDWDFMFSKIVESPQSFNNSPSLEPKTGVFGIWKMAAAAILVLLIGAVSYFILNKKGKDENITATQDHQKLLNDFAPGREGAILKLTNGRQIVLDSVNNGTLAIEGIATITKQNGQLVYTAKEKSTQPIYNTMITPRGRQYQLVLTDGSKVWLNAASSITFPTTFATNERKVSITGEAYFEVAHKPASPFKVSLNGMEVQVLGTHFNINAYENDNVVKTTLLEGRVMVKKDSKNTILNPGQQAVLLQSPGYTGEIQVASNVNTEEVMAWKDGRFYFENADIQTIMKQLQRWYDMDVSYPNGMVQGHYRGKISRNVNATQVLKILEEGGLNFRIDGKKLMIFP